MSNEPSFRLIASIYLIIFSQNLTVLDKHRSGDLYITSHLLASTYHMIFLIKKVKPE